MVISSELSLIPYPLDSYQLKPFTANDLSPRQDNVKGEIHQFDQFRRAKLHHHFSHKNRMHANYGAGNQIISPKIGQLGSLIDVYV
jgi:hypothetical protein